MIQDYDRPVKGYKTNEMYDHPETVLYDNFAPSEEVFVETAVEESDTTGTIEENVEEIVEEVEESEVE